MDREDKHQGREAGRGEKKGSTKESKKEKKEKKRWEGEKEHFLRRKEGLGERKNQG